LARGTEDLEDFLEEHEEPEDVKDIEPAGPTLPGVKDKYSAAMAAYFAELQRKCDAAYDAAQKARANGSDPEAVVEIPQSEDLAARVENLLAPSYPFVRGVAPRIRELSAKHNREEVSLLVAKDFAAQLAPKEGKEIAVDGAVRVGLAILTEGVLVAPLEGVLKVAIGANHDGTDFVAVHYAGPIRAAGGTAQALSVLIADVVRRELGIGKYLPTEPEVERLKEEIPAYKQSAHLQVLPTPKEIELIANGCPVMIDGEGTEDQEISGNRDLPRIETNRLRGGACLVMAEGLILKATKVQKHVKNLKISGWEWLDAFVNKKKDGDADGKEKTPLEAATGPNPKYMEDLVAGRPVFAHPGRKGGFRLRYGRARTGGIASTAIHPATMTIVEDFLALGTQMKIERPGKATVATPCDTIEGPLVQLDSGDVVRLTTAKQAASVAKRVRRILDLGEILIPYGEFAENNKPLVPAGYCREWWEQEAARKGAPPVAPSTGEDAVRLASSTQVPLHPDFTLFWHDLSASQVLALRDLVLAQGRLEGEALVLPGEAHEPLVELGCTHRKRPPAEVAVDDAWVAVLLRCLGLQAHSGAIASRAEPPAEASAGTALDLVSALAGFTVRAKSPHRIGARMGRPEKAAERKMSPPVHVLFPIGQNGGQQRLLKDAAAKGTIQVEVGQRLCKQCGAPGVEVRCATCNARTVVKRQDKVEATRVDLRDLLQRAQERAGMPKLPETIKGVQGLISKTKTPEALEKGLLRAKHEVTTFKDGTCRYDMTDVPLTHFKPREVHTSVARLRELGYTTDCKGQPLERDDQVLELRVQDVVVPLDCLQYLQKVAAFVDEELEKVYGLQPFYKAKEPEHLVGHLVVGLAPHTSGGILGRVVGWTRTQAGLAHPYWHAAKRRNCLDPASEVVVFNSPRPTRRTLEALWAATPGEATRADDLGAEAKAVHGLEVLSPDPATGKVERKRVTKVYRVPAPDHLVHLRTASGRSVRCSPDHRLLVAEGTAMAKRRALELKPGAVLGFASRVPLPEEAPEPLDLLLELAPQPPPGLVVRGLGPWLEARIAALGGLAKASKALGLTPRGLDNYRRRGSMPIATLHRLLQVAGLGLPDVPRGVRLAVARDDVEMPRRIALSPEFLRLAGYYLAEGHCRGRDGGVFQVSIAATEADIVEDVLRCAEASLGLRTKPGKASITFSGRLVVALFDQVLGLGRKAPDKRIPPRIASLPPALTAELLAAYFAGDGSVEQGRLHVSCTSVSEGLLRDVGLQLASRGIVHRLRRDERPGGGAVEAFLERKGRPNRTFVSHRLSLRSSHAAAFAHAIGFAGSKRKQAALEAALALERSPREERGPGDLVLDEVVSAEVGRSTTPYLYDLEVEDHHTYLVNDLLASSNCDGDEDCVMLLLDGLLNFSRAYLPEKRGGLMDAPLVLTTRLDPSEVDKEAQNMDCSWVYPLEFYEATQRCPSPKEVEKLIDSVGKRIGSEGQYEGLGFTHDTTDIGDGPAISSYKTLGTMMEKMESQLRLAERLRAVDEADVAARVIEGHFLRDLQGNLKKFSKQKVRCVKCGAKFRRPPLKGTCLRCNNNLTMTVHHASVIKYLEVSKRVSEKYHVKAYTKQRLALLEQNVNSLFQSDKVKKTSLKDFFG
jgi:DNA polymerase II large subunit